MRGVWNLLMPEKKKVRNQQTTIKKARTGIQGLDEITFGGLPAGRPTLVCGSAGAGKTMLAAEFIVRGAVEFGEPGVFMMFEENEDELKQNVRSLGFDLDDLQAKKLISLDHVHIERSEIEETGEYDLEGLFIRLGHAIDSIGAKRVALDTLEALFSGLPNHAILRAELRRLFRWLKDRGMTAVITGERGENSLTRYGLEEYVAIASSFWTTGSTNRYRPGGCGLSSIADLRTVQMNTRSSLGKAGSPLCLSRP